MYKGTSKAQQHRTRSGNFGWTGELSRKNASGVTADTFADDPRRSVDERGLEFERQQVIAERQEIERRMLKLRENVGHANATRQRSGIFTDAKLYWGWKSELLALGVKHQALQVRLSELKAAIQDTRNNNFERIFVDVCREMLASEIFDRLMRAATERAERM